jgi:hypothetical protein
MKAATLISTKIEKIPKGEPFSSTQFLGLGARASVDQALSRLVKKGLIARVSRGLYVRPEISKHVGRIMPGPNKVVEAYARAKGFVIQEQGAEAARRFGLSTQVPVQSVFYTSGPTKQFKLGKLNVFLKHVSPKKMVFPGTKVGLAITALWHLGKENVNSATIESIRKKMLPSEFEDLKMATPSMPAWMADNFYRYESEQKRAR